MKSSKGNYEITNYDSENIGFERMYEHIEKMDNVYRLSGFYLIQPYTLTQHCYRTGLLFMEICHSEHIIMSYEELDFVFKHDILETVTGDLLYPVKHISKEAEEHWNSIEDEIVREGTLYSYMLKYTDKYAENIFRPETWQLFKECDLYELYLFSISEYRLGNKGIIKVIYNCQNILKSSKFKIIRNGIERLWI